MIEILSPSHLVSVQDLGRFGHLHHGVGISGAMDKPALCAGNLMLANPPTAAGIEIPFFPLRLRFHRACTFALTGADAGATLDDTPMLPWWCARADAGQTLTFHRPRYGVRAYLTVAGGIQVAPVLGSRSTQLRGGFGGLAGRTLQQGDQLPLAADADAGPGGFGIQPPPTAMPLTCAGLPAVRVIPAAEYPLFPPACREAFWREPWKVTSQSNRYGYRLAGTPLLPERPLEMRSHGIVAGVIQVPHGGQPIIQMRDAQPMGGYPKFGTVIEADLWRLSQIPIGRSVRFIEVDYAQGIAALDEVERYLTRVREMVAIARLSATPA
ncbi:Urea amidolyase related protein [Sodalis praecaptivus]|uniref:Urea amidolyase related protein n=1 Tax=Sodalis praecaptivus TaxID=1239307 RepID=W0HS10_9GAMM|nr:biotin-dependent carboxyltransferase family protein [Sodalis praecaptivus]AHF76616.1 Urea amidolyase related protein [Sodalis praecaptivus]